MDKKIKSKFKNIIFDLDGVVYLGDKLIDGIDQTLEKLRENNFRIFFITNNATKSRREIIEKLNHLGLSKIKEKDIMSSAYAAAFFASSKGFKHAFVIGENGLKEEVRNFGIKILEQESELSGTNSIENACLISGLDRNFNYSKLKQVLTFLFNNKKRKWIACNLDPTYPVNGGIDPGAGAIAASIAFSLGSLNKNQMILRYPDFVVGKPSLFMLDLLLKKSEKAHSIFVGDRLDVDIPFAKKGGLFSVLVLTGITKKTDFKYSRLKPDAILESAFFLPEFLGI